MKGGHVDREQNAAANCLAKISLDLNNRAIKTWSTTPLSVRNIIEQDKHGKLWPRKVFCKAQRLEKNGMYVQIYFKLHFRCV